MSSWDPKAQWKKLRLETEAIYLYEQTSKGNFLFLENRWDDMLAADSTLMQRTREQEESGDDGFGSDYIPMEQRPKCETWEDLRTVVALMAHGERVKELAAAGGNIGSGAATILGLIPGASTVVNWAQIPAKLMKKPKDFGQAVKKLVKGANQIDAPDEKLKKPASGILDAFRIDDGYQKIVDSEVEAKFLEDFEKWVSDPKKTGKLPDKDINEWFENWLSKNHGSGKETVTGAESSTKFTEIPKVVDNPSEFEKKVEKIGGALGATLKGFMGL